MVACMNPSERLGERYRNGGKRSRGPSPNGHNDESSNSSGDDSVKKSGSIKTSKPKSEYEEKIRVGREYQAVCPEFKQRDGKETLIHKALLVWSPTKDIPDNKIDEYIEVAKEKYGYNGEQALGMLFWHKHDLERAILDLENFTPFPDDWTDEDKILFEQAYSYHGKSFHRIHQMIPDKPIASLVKYYYSWKKTRSRTNGPNERQPRQKSKDSYDANGESSVTGEYYIQNEQIDLTDEMDDDNMDDVSIVGSIPAPISAN